MLFRTTTIPATDTTGTRIAVDYDDGLSRKRAIVAWDHQLMNPHEDAAIKVARKYYDELGYTLDQSVWDKDSEGGVLVATGERVEPRCPCCDLPHPRFDGDTAD